MQTPLASIIIPVYNAANYLEETIKCALNQTWPNKEIIVVDDGSTDDSLAIAKKYIPQGVKLFSQPNSGASTARNKGLAESKGDFIQFLDADDLLSDDKIENQLKAIKDLDAAAVYGPYAVFFTADDLTAKTNCYLTNRYENGREFLFELYGGLSRGLAPGGMIPTVCWLVSRAVVEKAGHWDETLTVDDDGEFFCRVALNASAIEYADNAISFYRHHEHNNNLSSQNSYNSFVSAFKALKLKSKHINDRQFNPLIANQAILLLVSIYPHHPDLCKQIQQFINDLGGNLWQPYQENPHKFFRKLFGWRFVKRLSHYKNK